MVVEYMPNGALVERMPKSPLTATQALALLRPLGEALDYAHQQGVLHRDVKPANVFLDSELQPVLADFGLAKMLGEQSLTASGMISGTPTHISPEQTMGKPLDAQSDLYSLAVIGYQLLTARLPFQGEGMMDLLYAHVHTDVPPPTSFNPALPAPVDGVMLRALAKNPRDRYESAAELMGTLEAAAAGRVDERKPPPSVETAVAMPGVEAPATPPAPAKVDARDDDEPKPSRRRLWAMAALVVVLLIAAGAGYTQLSRGGTIGGTGVLPTPGASHSPTATRSVEVNPPSPLKMGSPITVSGPRARSQARGCGGCPPGERRAPDRRQPPGAGERGLLDRRHRPQRPDAWGCGGGRLQLRRRQAQHRPHPVHPAERHRDALAGTVLAG